MDCVKILSPCGILGYGFPPESLKAGLADEPDAIVVDAGSTDAGPHKLGAKTAIVSKTAAKKDLSLLISAEKNTSTGRLKSYGKYFPSGISPP